MMKGIFSFSSGDSVLYGPLAAPLAVGGAVSGIASDLIGSAGPSTSVIESGGGAATPVAEDFAAFLQRMLSGGGQPGSDPVGQTQGIMQSLQQLIAGVDVSGQQGAIQQIIQTDTERQASNLRERFTAGGGSRGTPSAVAEGLFRSEVTPRIAKETGELELRANQQRIQALLPFLQILSQFAGRGVPQAREDIVIQPGWLELFAGLVEGGAGIAGAGG